jgi:hypothetical protein
MSLQCIYTWLPHLSTGFFNFFPKYRPATNPGGPGASHNKP